MEVDRIEESPRRRQVRGWRHRWRNLGGMQRIDEHEPGPLATAPGGERGEIVQVAESLERRTRLANEIIKGVIFPQFLILPVAVTLVWFGLSRGLSPLKSLQRRIRDRSPDDLSPIDPRGAPEEIAPLVDKILFHEVNQGKGAALRTGFRAATGDVVVVQDADLEYDPQDYPRLLQPILEGKADVVFGSRFQGGQPHRVVYFWHMVGNKLLTLLSNMATNINLTDMETCYKVFRREVLQRIEIEENRFGFEPEITAKVARLGVVIYEVGISYYGRTYAEGKKIGWRDGFRALWAIAKYNLLRR